jgi:hypothetical protein
VTPDLVPASAAVIILGGDMIIGHTLELLLQSGDCSVKFLAEPPLDELGLLDGVRLLILAPRLGAERCDALLRSVSSKPVGERIPVLELVVNTEEVRIEEGHFVVPWPCRTEDLKLQVEDILLVEPGTNPSQPSRPANLQVDRGEQ